MTSSHGSPRSHIHPPARRHLFVNFISRRAQRQRRQNTTPTGKRMLATRKCIFPPAENLFSLYLFPSRRVRKGNRKRPSKLGRKPLLQKYPSKNIENTIFRTVCCLNQLTAVKRGRCDVRWRKSSCAKALCSPRACESAIVSRWSPIQIQNSNSNFDESALVS